MIDPKTVQQFLRKHGQKLRDQGKVTKDGKQTKGPLKGYAMPLIELEAAGFQKGHLQKLARKGFLFEDYGYLGKNNGKMLKLYFVKPELSEAFTDGNRN